MSRPTNKVLPLLTRSSVAVVMLFALLVFSHLGSMGLAHASSQQVEKLRLWHSPDRTRVVFDVSANVRHKMFTLQNPRRLVVDIENANLSKSLPQVAADNAHIEHIRFGRPDSKMLRFVFELKKPLESKIFVLSPNELYGHRLVVDLVDNQANPIVDEVAELLREHSPEQQEVNAAKHNPAKPQTKPVIQKASIPKPRTLLIAIDAGHGGEDPGAIGYRGSHEKKLTLAIAEKLKQTIDRDPRMKSFLIRKGDYYVNLHKRREIAKAANADLFISIHADAFTKRSARGFSVFTLSQSGATSAMARQLAAKENASDLIGGVSLADKGDVLKKVLVDLSMTNTISESVNFGGRVIKELSRLGKMHSRKVEQAGFAVLKSADIPSVLIETGFITNPDEERNLRSSRYQQKVATAIYTAVKDYFEQTPFRNNTNRSYTSYAQATPVSAGKPKYHKVVRGDSLSKIAMKYGVSLSELKKTNKLRSNVAMLGTRLKIPQKAGSQVARNASRNTKPPAIHTVLSGETLSILSKRYNVTIRSLKRENNLKSETVYIGMRLKIPGGVAVHQTNSVANKARTHVVRRGDTLSEIAERYGSSMRGIQQANSLRSGTVMLGQKLIIPSRN